MIVQQPKNLQPNKIVDVRVQNNVINTTHNMLLYFIYQLGLWICICAFLHP